MFTLTFIFIILFLALSYKEALISLIAVPLTFFITFFVLYIRGDTINSLTLFSLVLSLGLLVDTFIVIMEGIFDNLRKGYRALDASLLSVAIFRKPLLSGVLTTVSAFVPMLLVSGILGEYLKVLPNTIAVTLLSSLFVSLVIVPAIASVMLKQKKAKSKKRQESLMEKFLTNRLKAWYGKSVDNFLKKRKIKVRFTIILILGFAISLGLLITGRIPVKLFPNVDIDFTFIDIELPIGTDLDTTDEAVQKVENYFYTRPEIKNFVTTIGRTSSFGFSSGGSNSDHLANIRINFVDEKDRDKKSFDISDDYRNELKVFDGVNITVRDFTGGPPTGAPIEVRIKGPELSTISMIESQLITILNDTEGVIDIESDENISPAEFAFVLDRDALGRSGLTVGEVSSFLRSAIFGVTATKVTLEGEDIDVVVKLDDEAVNNVDDIKNLSITNNRGENIKLARLADFTLSPSLAAIRHRDLDRTVSVRTGLEKGFTPTKVVPEVEKKLKETRIPKGYIVNFGGEVEDIQQSFTELWYAMIVAVLLIMTILILQFNSFKTPLTIFFTLPLMLIGVVIGMLILRLPFSFSTFIGIVALGGIVVNDAIVLIDKANQNVNERKMPFRKAVTEAGVSRLQPIILTTVTTVIGVIPLAVADEFWYGLSTAIAFGLTFATILTLYVVPMFFLRLEGRAFSKRSKKKEEREKFHSRMRG